MKASSARQFLSLLAILHIIVGLILPFIANTRLFNYYNEKMLVAFNTSSIESLELGKFMIGILGPSIASWGVLFLFLVQHAYRTGSSTAWITMIIAIVGWSIYDMALSVYAGVYLNLLIDCFVMSLLLIPLILTKSHFYKQSYE